MIAFLRTWILNIVTVVIFITFLEILLPNNQMKKYIKMTAGLLVMLVVMNPILELVNGKVRIEDEIFKTSSMIDQHAMASNSSDLKKVNNQQLVSLVKTKIENQVTEKLRKEFGISITEFEVEVEDDQESKEFGKIKKMTITIDPNDQVNHDEVQATNTIQPIKINVSIQNETKKQSQPSEKGDIQTENIKKSISRFYEIEEDNIIISVYKTSH